MTRTDILQFVEVHGYNPERRSSNRWHLEVRDVNGRVYKGFGLHVLHDPEHAAGDVIALYHDRGRMVFHVDQVEDAGWYRIREWTSVAERVA